MEAVERKGRGHSKEGLLNSVHEFFRRRKHAFLLSYTILFAVAALLCFHPFIFEGKSIIWGVDGLEQYYVYFAYFGWWVREIAKESIASGSFVLPQWDLSFGYGSDLFATLGASFANPFNYIAVFFPQKYAEHGFNLAVLLKVYCAGLTFKVYASERGNGRFPVLVGSLCYAFSGWTLSCIQQPTFMETLILFPLLLAGLERVFRKESPALLIVSSAFYFAFSFYFSYIAFIIFAFYAVARFFGLKEYHNVKAGLLLIGSVFVYVIIGLLISCVLLLPTLAGFLGQSRLSLERSVPFLYSANETIQLLKSFFGYVRLGEDSTFAVNALALIACVAMFRNPGRKTLKIGVLSLFAITFLPIIDSVLNGFQYPSHRWLWVFSACLSYAVVVELPTILERPRAIVLPTILLVSVFGVLFAVFPDGHSPATVAGLLILSFSVLVLLAINYSSKPTKQNLIRSKFAIVLIVLVSASAPFHYFLVEDKAIESEVKYDSAWQEQRHGLVSSTVEKIGDDSLWRYDICAVSRLRNGSLLSRQHSFDFYSTYYNNYINALNQELELSDSQIVHCIKSLTSRGFLESAMGAKYFVVSSDPSKDGDISDRIPKYASAPAAANKQPVAQHSAKGKTYFALENNAALPLAYTFDKSISSESWQKMTAVQRQQAMLQAVVLESSSEDDSDIEYSDFQLPYTIGESDGVVATENGFTATKEDAYVMLDVNRSASGELYVELQNIKYEKEKPTLIDGATFPEVWDYIQSIYAWKPEKNYDIVFESPGARQVSYRNYTTDSHMYGGNVNDIVNLGNIDGDVSQVKIVFKKAGKYTFDGMNIIVQPTDKLMSYVEERTQYPVTLTMGMNSFEATVENGEDQVLFFSIPWSSGWSATVDGEAAVIQEADTAFMAIDLPAGKHTIKLRYQSPGLKMGAILTMVGIILALLSVLIHRWFKNRSKNNSR